ncbi:exosortase A [Aquisalimonas asiatica]|uniref:Exosortase A n=1 Tax=Aquisalimonas asiatica TaxID=406100 RepID=A0A1H8U3Y1_9GAMM|nr:exosortase A [Aquisalimonas asiatica]SEO97777.1 exosortase A [Aquisalimonas asiatica]
MAVDRQAFPAVGSVPEHWRRPLTLVAAAIALLLVVFHATYWSMVETWIRSETFAHGFLIVPIALFLVWRQRRVLADVVPRPFPLAGVVLAGLATMWLLGELVDVISVRQFSVVLMIPAVVWLMLGTHVVWRLQFPLAYLLFAVPFGEFLVQPLMVFTADVTVGLVRLTGIPVFREGLYFSLPTGHWAVVEACSGVRYLIASVALGALYAHITYRSWFRRCMFMLAAIIVPILANGLRAYMIVMIGHFSDMSLAAGVDHLLYGWVFFGIVIFLMFWVGGFWREDARPAASPARHGLAAGGRPSAGRYIAALALTVALIVAAPLYAAWMDRAAWPAPDLGAAPETIGDWQLTGAEPAWTPGYRHARDEWHAEYQSGGDRVGLYTGVYAEQNRYGKMATWENTLAGRGSDDWRRQAGGRGPDGAQRQLLVGPDTRVVAWQWYWVDGRLTTSRHLVKGLEALSRLLGGTDDAANIVIYATYRDRPDEVEPAMEVFAEEARPVIEARLEEVGRR